MVERQNFTEETVITHCFGRIFHGIQLARKAINSLITNQSGDQFKPPAIALHKVTTIDPNVGPLDFNPNSPLSIQYMPYQEAIIPANPIISPLYITQAITNSNNAVTPLSQHLVSGSISKEQDLDMSMYHAKDSDTAIVTLSSTSTNNPHGGRLELCSVVVGRDGSFKQIDCKVSPNLLSAALSKYDNDPFILLLRTTLHLPKCDDHILNQWMKFADTMKEMKHLRKEMIERSSTFQQDINANGPLKNVVGFVPQGYYGVSDNDTYILATDSLDTCFSIGIVNKNTRKSTLVHFAVGNPITTLSAMREQLSSNNEDPLVITLTGARNTDYDLVLAYRLIKQWQDMGMNIEIIIGPVFKSSQDNNSDSLAVNSYTCVSSTYTGR